VLVVGNDELWWLWWRRGYESEKNDRWPEGKVGMMLLTIGSLIDGQVEVQIFCQSLSSVERACNSDDAQAVAARVGPSRRVRIWVWRMSRWRVEMVPP
jgi:hypothetical protein